MKLLSILLLLLLLLSGCVEKQIILVPESGYMPTFNTDEFNVSKSYHLDMWAIKDKNSTSVCTKKTEMLGLIRDTKELRYNYNLLIIELNKFNEKIKELNKVQNEKKPKEVDTIPTSWF